MYTGGIGAAAIFSMQATMSASDTHCKSYFLSLSFVDQSQLSPSLAPLYLCGALGGRSLSPENKFSGIAPYDLWLCNARFVARLGHRLRKLLVV